MSSRRPKLLIAAAVVLLCLSAVYGMRHCAASLRHFGNFWPSGMYARARVASIVFVRNHALVTSDAHELFRSDDDGHSWRELPSGPFHLHVANGDELWSAYGGVGVESGPSGAIWHSTDLGETWSTRELAPLDGGGSDLRARLPAAFINEPADSPLLLMSDFHLARPAVVADSSTWQRVARPVTGREEASISDNIDASGIHHGHAIYLASWSHLFYSGDDGMTWTARKVHQFQDADIRCTDTACYALLSVTGSEWNGLMSTDAGSDHWKLVRELNVADVTAALTADGRHATVHAFAACAVVPTSNGAFVAGIVDAGDHAWGAVLFVGHDGTLKSVGHGVPDGLWVLERAPDGALWAGGNGAYRLQGDEWVRVWSSTTPTR